MKIKFQQFDQLMPLEDMLTSPYQSNVHPPEQIQRLASIMKEHGVRHPIHISKRTNTICFGHGRRAAALLNGWTSYPIVFQEFDSDQEEFACVQSDNAIATWAELDRSKIMENIKNFPDLNMELLGLPDFKEELSNLFEEPLEEDLNEDDSQDKDEKDLEEKEEEIEENEQIPEKIEPRTKENDHYRIGAHQLYNGDCLKRMKLLQNDSIDSLVTDPPAGIAFMGKEWDEDKGGSKEWITWMTRVMQQAFRVLKPGAHGLVWAIPRTSHWTASALEDTGFEIRDVVIHLFGSGFPKSLDISKAIDKSYGAEREVIGKMRTHNIKGGALMDKKQNEMIDITTPSTSEAKQWQGWGTALKPASEHWILIRKPCAEDTVAKNVLKFGTGGINIDASRIATQGEDKLTPRNNKIGDNGWKNSSGGYVEPSSLGRFPANLILSHNSDCVEVGTKKVKGGSGWSKSGSKESENTSMNGKNYDRAPKPDKYKVNEDGTETVSAFECTEGCAVKLLDEQSGVLKSGFIKKDQYKDGLKNEVYGKFGGFELKEDLKADSGGASRFFYVAKPSKSEKNDATSNIHPTVKSIKLMSYLINMITPPNGTLLDCFGGSGTTLVASHLNGFKSILFEQSCEYCDIILARAEKVTQQKSKLING